MASEESDRTALLEQVLSIGDGGAKASLTRVGEYLHTLRHVFAVLGLAREFFLQPVVDRREGLTVAQLLRSKLPHNPYKLRTKIAPNNTNTVASAKQTEGQGEQWGIIPADNSNIIANTASNHSTRCIDFASEVEGAEVRDSPVNMFDDGRRAAEGDGEGKGLHGVSLDRLAHPPCFASSETIDVLICTTAS